MSADNWGDCPRCARGGKTRLEKLTAAYGVVPEVEYKRLFDEAKDDWKRETLREDYEIGISDGEFYVGYSGLCSECGFEFKFKHTQAVS